MPIYINQNNQQSGPYEDHVVIDRLQSGELSPNDMGIRQGGTTWERLGDIFPGAVPKGDITEQETGADPATAAAIVPAPKGGCRKIFGWTVFVLGILMMLGGFGAAAVNRTIDHPLCQNADRYAREAEEAQREVQAARGTPREAEALRKMTDKTTSLKVSTKSCADMTDYYRWWFIALLGIGAFGFVIALIGFFVRRV